MKTQLENTGERMIPEHHKGKNIYGAHIGRYQAGEELVKGKIILDIACGSGYGSKLMSATAKKVYGVDVDKDTVEYAKEHFGASNITYLVGDGIKIPLEDDAVDMVVSYETIEHIDDYPTFLSEVKRVLKPGGILLLSTPNDVEYAEGNHYHLHEFNYSELKKLVGKYFKFRKDFFQTLWLYSSILPEDMQTKEWVSDVRTTNTVPLKPEQCIYFFMICSDQEISETIKPQAVIGEHFRQRALQEREQKQRAMAETIQKQKSRIDELTQSVQKKKKELESIHGSKAWKLVRGMQRTSGHIPRRNKKGK